MTEFISVYVTAPSLDVADKIARVLVEEKLAACANIMPGLHSIYRWQGKVEEADEVAIVVKTRADLFAAVEARVKALHPYECPCIVAWPIATGYQPYLDWLKAETGK